MLTVFVETTGGKEQPVGPVPREPEPLLDEDPPPEIGEEPDSWLI